jgi:hypothetical protein
LKEIRIPTAGDHGKEQMTEWFSLNIFNLSEVWFIYYVYHHIFLEYQIFLPLSVLRKQPKRKLGSRQVSSKKNSHWMWRFTLVKPRFLGDSHQ